jgi:hypothetical protein
VDVEVAKERFGSVPSVHAKSLAAAAEIARKIGKKAG